jgi:hypothetical protein
VEEERVILLITSGIYNRFNLQRTEMRAGYKTVAVLAKTVTEPQMEDVMTKSLLQCFFSQRHANPTRLNLRRNKCPNNLTDMWFVLQSNRFAQNGCRYGNTLTVLLCSFVAPLTKQLSYSDERCNGSRRVANGCHR